MKYIKRLTKFDTMDSYMNEAKWNNCQLVSPELVADGNITLNEQLEMIDKQTFWWKMSFKPNLNKQAKKATPKRLNKPSYMILIMK